MSLKTAVAALVVLNLIVIGVTQFGGEAAAQSTPTVIRAQAIELVDSKGQVRAQLNVESSGEAVFRMRDAGGTIRVKIGADADGSGLLLLDESTEPAVHMLAKRNGTSVTIKRGTQQQVLQPSGSR